MHVKWYFEWLFYCTKHSVCLFGHSVCLFGHSVCLFGHLYAIGLIVVRLFMNNVLVLMYVLCLNRYAIGLMVVLS